MGALEKERACFPREQPSKRPTRLVARVNFLFHGLVCVKDFQDTALVFFGVVTKSTLTWTFDQLDFANAGTSVLDGEDVGKFFLEGVTTLVNQQATHEFLRSLVGELVFHDLDHSLANSLDLGGLGVRGLLALTILLLRESHGKHSEDVVVGGFDVNVSLDESHPLFQHRARPVSSKFEAVEIKVALLVGRERDSEFQVDGCIKVLIVISLKLCL